MSLARAFGLLAATAVFLFGCATLPPDPVTSANYALIEPGMTKEQVFAILGPGAEQSETTMAGITIEIYVWSPRTDYSGSQLITVSFRDGREMSKVKVGM